MVIGIDASRANAKKKTGTEWYSYHVIQELKKIIPLEHRVVLYSRESLRGELGILPEGWSSRVLTWPPQFLWTQLRLSFEMLFHRPKVLYIPTHTIPMIHPKHVVVVIHDVGFARTDKLYNHAVIGYHGLFSKKIINLLVRLLTLGRYGATEHDYHRFSVEHALRAHARIITVSAFSQKEIHNLYAIPLEKIKVIPNGLNQRQPVSLERTKEILEKYRIRSPYILSIGRVEEKKNIPRFIEAFALLRSQYGFTGQLVLAGSPGFGHDRVRQALERHDLGNAVIETGWVEEEDVSALFSSAGLFVLPSLYEGFGIPILEAMSLSVPVVCSSIPALHEVAGDAALLVDPYSIEQMAKTMHAVLSQQEVRESLIRKGRERAEQFSWKKTADATWGIVQQYEDCNQ